ncbi:hypothetical protein ACFX13_022264 [Malus domestica]
MDRDRKANTTWFTQIGYVHGIEEFSLIVKGLHKYIGSSSPLVDVASSLEVLFLHPGVVSVTGGDAQGNVSISLEACSFRLGQARYKPCSRSPPSRRARGSAERGDRQGLFLNRAGGFSGFLQSIRPTKEFEGQNKSIKSRVRSTLLIWDTFAFDRVVDVLARMLLRLSLHASLYPSHLPYLFLRQMRYLPWKHKMLKMSTREQCQVRTRPKEKTGKKHDMGYSCF